MNPAEKVNKDFKSRLVMATEHHKELLLAIYGKKRQAALETMLAEQFTLNILVLWEVYLSDLLISYLTLSPKRYRDSWKEKVKQSIGDRFGPMAPGMVKFSVPKTFTVPKARALVDPKQFNVTFQTADVLSSRANELLAAEYARLFTLEPEDSAFVNFVIAIRNFLAHRSPSARKLLRDRTAVMAGANAAYSGDIANVGGYLKHKVNDQTQRAILIADRLVRIAERLEATHVTP